jgi:hypothetical protein
MKYPHAHPHTHTTTASLIIAATDCSGCTTVIVSEGTVAASATAGVSSWRLLEVVAMVSVSVARFCFDGLSESASCSLELSSPLALESPSSLAGGVCCLSRFSGLLETVGLVSLAVLVFRFDGLLEAVGFDGLLEGSAEEDEEEGSVVEDARSCEEEEEDEDEDEE